MKGLITPELWEEPRASDSRTQTNEGIAIS